MIPRHGLIEAFNFVAGILLNAFLLYLIRRFSSKTLGTYKHLLTIFAAQDIFLSLVEALFNVTAVRVDTIISVVARTFWESRHIASAYVTFYTLPFFLTNFNFLYRYLAIKIPDKVWLYSNKKFQFALFIFAATTLSAWYLTFIFVCGGDVDDPATVILRESYKAEFNITIYDGWVTLEYWPDGHFSPSAFFVLVFTDVILVSSSLSSVTLCTLTFYHIQVNTGMSAINRKSQRWMLIALCAQAIVPLLCVYIPYVSNLNTPFFGVANVVPQEVSASFISAFPLWDAAVIILLMKDYRVGALSIIMGDKNKKIDTMSRIFATSFDVSRRKTTIEATTAI